MFTHARKARVWRSGGLTKYMVPGLPRDGFERGTEASVEGFGRESRGAQDGNGRPQWRR
jgi:hypothetical protein